MMDNTAADIQHCDEQLKTTLQYDDKEKLRQKLLLLQREYVRTAQRLQRAERSDGVRKHLTSRIKQPPPALQREKGQQEVGKLLANGEAPVESQDKGEPEDIVGSSSRLSVGPLLPSEAAQTTDPIHDPAPRDRPSPAASQFRSRLGRRSSGKRKVDSVKSEDGRKQTQTTDAPPTEATARPSSAADASHSEEVHSGSDSDSSSLLLTHWKTVQSKKGSIENKKVHGESEKGEKGTDLDKKELDSKCLLVTPHNDEMHSAGRQTGKDDTQVAHGNINTEQNAEEQRKCEDGRERTVGDKGLNGEPVQKDSEEEVKAVGLLDSCTLVEGLLFPAEYYVRTTRRMASSQSQPDMRAVILSQLNVGRHPRGRGRGRRSGNCKDVMKTQNGSSPPAAATAQTAASARPCVDSQDPSAAAGLNILTCSDASDHLHSSVNGSSPAAAAARPARGRRRRGKGARGRVPARSEYGAKSRRKDGGQTSEDVQPTSCPLQGSPEGESKPPPLAGDSPPLLTDTTDSMLSSASSGQQLYPIFLKGTNKTSRSPHMEPRSTDWQSLHLPSLPPSQTPLIPLPSLRCSLVNFDLPQDFHLPDDQFASLKLHKLHQVALDSGLERFSPSYNTRRSLRRYESYQSSGDDQPSPLSLPFALTPTVSHSPNPTTAKPPPAQYADLLNSPVSVATVASQTSPSSAEVASLEAAGLRCEHRDGGGPPSKTSEFSTRTAAKQQRDSVTGNVSEIGGKACWSGNETMVQAEEDHTNVAEAKRETPSSTPSVAPHEHAHLDVDPPVENVENAESATDDPKESPETALSRHSPAEEPRPQPLAVPTQVLPSQPPPTSALSPPTSVRSPTPGPACPDLPASLVLPSLGVTPQVLPLTCSPSAPLLTLPPPPSPPQPDTRPLSPPPLSPGLPFSGAPEEAPYEAPQSYEQGVGATASKNWSEVVEGQSAQRMEETELSPVMTCTHTLKSPAGGSLVDACCFPGASGRLCVAAAGKWAVCLWSQTSSSDWTLMHTWSFSEPVISVLAVPDAPGLMCVTLGRLEIREVRMLSCSSLSQTLLCRALVQAVVAVSGSRVVCSVHSAAGSTLQLFTLSDSCCPIQPRHLVAPDVCVRALAPVDGLPDALIGTDEGSLLFIWNLKSGQMLQRILLPDGSSNSACLRASSSRGVLLVLLQHQLLSSLEEVGRQHQEDDQELSEKQAGGAARKTGWLSLIAVNPLNGRSAWAGKLYPPEAWSGRLCEADADARSVVGLSQSGSVCVWELGRRGSSRMVGAPPGGEGEGWQLARWGRGGVLVTGHHNGDVTLHCRGPPPSSH